MKKVSLEENKDIVHIGDLRSTNILGMQTIGGNKFILSRGNGFYVFIGHHNITSSEKTKYNRFAEALAASHSLFLFETTKELFKWMSE